VIHRHLITDQQLDTAVVVSRMTPGPVGVYVVSVGYFADRFAGAFAGWLATATPALLIIPLLKLAGSRAEHPRVRSAIQPVVLASAGLLWAAALPLAQPAGTDAVTAGIIVVSLIVLLTRKVESVWVVLLSGVLEVAASSFHLIHGLC
jgi:chromate transporter